MQTLESLIFLANTALKFRVLEISKFLTPTQTKIFQYPSSSCTYLWGIHSLRNNSTGTGSGYLYIVNQTTLPRKEKIHRNFILNTMMENKNQHFSSFLIPFLILFITKFITQIKILFSLNWRYTSEIYK